MQEPDYGFREELAWAIQTHEQSIAIIDQIRAQAARSWEAIAKSQECLSLTALAVQQCAAILR